MMLEQLKRMTGRITGIVTGKLANKLILILSPSVAVFIILLIFISYTRTTETLKNDFVENNKSILKLVIQNFDNYIEQVDEFSLTPRMDVSGKFMKLLPLDDYDYESDNYIDEQIVNMFNIRQDVEEMRLYIPSGSKEKYISRTFPKVRNNINADFKSEAWYRQAIQGRYYRWIEPSSQSTEHQTSSGKRVLFTFYRALINISDQRPLGVIAISLNHTQINRMIRREYTQNGEIICIFDKNNKAMYFSDNGLEGNPTFGGLFQNEKEGSVAGDFNIKIDSNNYLAVYTASDNLEWKAVKLIPLDMLNEKVRETRNISIILAILFIVIFTLLIIFVSNLITGSLRSLSRQMDKVGGGNFKTKAYVRGDDEIAHLAQKFNYMVEQVDGLVNEKYIAQINEKTARLKALEAQINPHFIYNALQAISAKAVIGGMKDISRMIEALAYNLRYCIKGGDMVMVSNEIAHIENFLILHKARFEDRLSVEILVEEGTQDIVVPKLSIHTLVENSIKHCLEMMTDSILIRIHAYAGDGNITISVSDDGPGMTPERLEQVLGELEDPRWLEKPEESIGLKNLNARLKLLYGNDAFLVIKSSPNVGTEIKIVLPSK
jgi:two-component system, sensor histidine kinase YesM